MKPIKELWDRLKKEYDLATTMEETRSDSYNIDMRFNNLAVLELASQLQFLFELLGTVEDSGECLEGIINIIGKIQDDLSESYGFPDEIVYPFSNGYEPIDREHVNYKRAFKALINNIPLKELPRCLNLDPDLDTLLKRFFDKGDVL